jgi:FSR family fosmidomycin resistance protein-like MFS transporter
LILPIFVWIYNLHIATLLLVPIGIAFYAPYSPTIVLGQDYLPNRIGLSSGVTLGIAVAVGGGVALIIGRIADLYGIWFALALVACLPVLTSSAVWTLPEPKR